MDEFPQSVREHFDEYIRQQPPAQRSRVFLAPFTQIKYWLENPNAKVPDTTDKQAHYNARHQALAHYELEDGEVYRKADGKLGRRQVISVRGLFDCIARVHIDKGHGGRDACFAYIREKYYGVPEKDVNWVIQRCRKCMQTLPNRNQPILNPIVVSHRLERVQIDLVDFQRYEDNGMK